jgi:ferredoxin
MSSAREPQGAKPRRPRWSRARKWRLARRALQTLSLAAFLYLFWRVFLPLPRALPLDLYQRLDPLHLLSTSLAGRMVGVALWSGALMLMLAPLLGRAFCGWLCPLGTAVDAVDLLLFRRRMGGKYRARLRQRWKYYLLVGLAGAAALGLQLAYLADPLTIAFRTLTVVVDGGLRWVWNGLVWQRLGLGPFLWDRGIRLAPLAGVTFHGVWFLSVFAFALVALGAVHRRFWCNSLCPLGALLGALSRFSLVRRIVGSSCNECGVCSRWCKMGALSETGRVNVSECVLCLNCMWRCPKQAIGFLGARVRRDADYLPSLPRRRVLGALALGVACGLAEPILRQRQSRNPLALRPPGAVPEEKFVDLCVRCGECWRACPTNALQPALGEAGLAGLFTPILVPAIGWCDAPCNLCGQLCPTQAIRALEVEQKKTYKIGLSSINRDLCIAWADRQACVVCQEVCAYSAIVFQRFRGVNCPVMMEDRCVGCGQCQFNCPATPVKAIGPRALSPRPGVGERRAPLAGKVRRFPGLGSNPPASEP